MIDLTETICLGPVARTHGIRGQLILRLNSIHPENIIKMETVFIEIDGLPVPFFVSEYANKGDDSIILTLEDIDSENAARELSGCKVFIETSCLTGVDASISDISVLVGYKVIDKVTGNSGTVKEVLDIEKNPLLCILYKKKEILVPIHNEFIKRIDHKKKLIYIILPEGITSLS